MSKFKNVLLGILRLLTPQDLERMTMIAKDSHVREKKAVGEDIIVFDATDFQVHSEEGERFPAPEELPRSFKAREEEQDEPLKIPPKTSSRKLNQKKAPHEKTESEKIVDIKSRKSKKSDDPLESVGIFSKSTIEEEEELEKAREEANRPTETEFVLIERERLKVSEDKLTKQSGLESYRKSTDMKLFSVSYKDENGHDKVKTQSPYGILVNKKQA